MARARRYLVLSDLHLADVEEHADGWKAHKSARYTCDDEIARAIDTFEAEARDADEDAVLVLNGDIFDFDLVTAIPEETDWPISRVERATGMRPTEQKSAWKLERLLGDHPVFVDALTRFLAGGHRIVYVVGNHDPELAFPEVEAVFTEALRERGRELGFDEQQLDLGRFALERWFYYVPGEIYVEHGHQYDAYNSLRYILSPFDKPRGADGEREITLGMGCLANRLMLGHMGMFNPHAGDYILGVLGYFKHWLKYYAFSRTRSIVLPWIVGSFRVLFRLLGVRRRVAKRRIDYGAALAAQARRSQLEVEQVEALHKLRDKPMNQQLFGMLRELWLDRVLMMLVMTGATVALALVPIPLWVKLVVPLLAFPLIYLAYEGFVTDDGIFAIERESREAARAIAEIVDVKVVTFGHTHVPELVPLSRGATYANTGTWAPVLSNGELKPGLRNALFVRFGDEGAEAPTPVVLLHSLGGERRAALASAGRAADATGQHAA